MTLRCSNFAMSLMQIAFWLQPNCQLATPTKVNKFPSLTKCWSRTIACAIYNGSVPDKAFLPIELKMRRPWGGGTWSLKQDKDAYITSPLAVPESAEHFNQRSPAGFICIDHYQLEHVNKVRAMIDKSRKVLEDLRIH